MDKNTAIIFEGVGKQYRLGRVGTGTLQHDINRWIQTSILKRPDPYLKVGDVNDRTVKGKSEYVWALRDISFKVEKGDVLGIIGSNGAGKSTLLKILSHITAPSVGTIQYRGRISSLLEVGTGFHPEMTAKENIYMNGAIMGMTRSEISSRFDDIVEFAGVERYVDTPVKRFSSGMTVRLGFSVAAFLEPEILVVDEVLAVGDAAFQKKAIGKMKDVSSEKGRTVIVVSHNMSAIRNLCRTCIVLKNGMMDYSGTVDKCIDRYINETSRNEDKPIVSHIKETAGFISIFKITLNGSENDSISISGSQKSILIHIEGHTSRQFNGSIEFKIFNISGTPMATYSENGYLNYCEEIHEGDFIMEREILLPKYVGDGLCYAELSISSRISGQHINYLYAPGCCMITFNGNSNHDTNPLTIQQAGFTGLLSRELMNRDI